jgi:hypothetical protein
MQTVLYAGALAAPPREPPPAGGHALPQHGAATRSALARGLDRPPKIGPLGRHTAKPREGRLWKAEGAWTCSR